MTSGILRQTIEERVHAPRSGEACTLSFSLHQRTAVAAVPDQPNGFSELLPSPPVDPLPESSAVLPLLPAEAVFFFPHSSHTMLESTMLRVVTCLLKLRVTSGMKRTRTPLIWEALTSFFVSTPFLLGSSDIQRETIALSREVYQHSGQTRRSAPTVFVFGMEVGYQPHG